MRLGLDFGGTNLKIGVFSETADEIDFSEISLKKASEENGFDKGLFKILEKYFNNHDITSAGLAIKGLVNRQTGELINDIGAANIFAETNLKKLLETEFGVPFTIENDARAYAYGEYRFGAGKNYSSIVVMTLGTGVGCAEIINNKLYYSNDPLSGVLGGHISIDRNGPECACGNKGCLELYCSATALSKIISEKHSELRSKNDILKDFFKDAIENVKYHQTLKEFHDNLALGVVNTIHAYGPEAVILGGGVMNSRDMIIPFVQKIVDKRAWTFPRGKVKLLASKLGNRAASIGAAFLRDN